MRRFLALLVVAIVMSLAAYAGAAPVGNQVTLYVPSGGPIAAGPNPGAPLIVAGGLSEGSSAWSVTASNNLVPVASGGFSPNIGFGWQFLDPGFTNHPSAQTLNNTIIAVLTAETTYAVCDYPEYTSTQGNGNNWYRVCVNGLGGTSTSFALYSDSHSSTPISSSPANACTTVAGNQYTWKSDKSGMYPTTFSEKLFDPANSNALVCSWSTTDTNNGPQGYGSAGMTFFSPDGVHGFTTLGLWNAVQPDSQAFAPIGSATPTPIATPSPYPTCTCTSAPTSAPAFAIAAPVTPIAAVSPGATSGPNGALGWYTTSNMSSASQPITPGSFAAGSSGDTTITVTPATTMQMNYGVGGAFINEQAAIWSALPQPGKQAMMNALFSPVNGVGVANIPIIRISIGSADTSICAFFSYPTGGCSYDDTGTNEYDPLLSKFTCANDAISSGEIPFLQAALALNPNLQIFATPWTMPAWMKTPTIWYGAYNPGGGASINTAYYQQWANYEKQFVQCYANYGVPIAFISPQNEPEIRPLGYGGMGVSGAQETTFIGTYLGPIFNPAGGGSSICPIALPSGTKFCPKIVAGDNNWVNITNYQEAVLGDATAGPLALGGAAWHCYSGVAGAVAIQNAVYALYPNALQGVSECDTFPGSGASDNDTLANWGNQLTIFPNAHGSYYLFWESLQGSGGSFSTNTDNGMFSVNTNTGAFTFHPNGAMAAMWNHAFLAGASNIVPSTSSNGLVQVACGKNADTGGTRACLVYNSDTVSHTPSFTDGSGYTFTAPALAAGSVASYKWGNTSSTACIVIQPGVFVYNPITGLPQLAPAQCRP
jgi:glucosylceramidase